MGAEGGCGCCEWLASLRSAKRVVVAGTRRGDKAIGDKEIRRQMDIVVRVVNGSPRCALRSGLRWLEPDRATRR